MNEQEPAAGTEPDPPVSQPSSSASQQAEPGTDVAAATATEASLPAPDPWSRPAVVAPPAMPHPAVAPAAPQASGWEWSRSASSAVERSPIADIPVTSPAVPEIAWESQRKPGRQSSVQRSVFDLFAIAVAMVGGMLALVGAFFQELQSGIGILVVVVAAPIIEEALKPSGVYLLLLKWPHVLRGRLHIALLCSLAGAVFGVIESLIYVELYYPDGNDSFVLFRFTVTPVMHAVASFIVGIGLTRGLIDWVNGQSPLPKTTRNCFIAGMGLHAAYNTAAVVLGLLGVLDFLDT